MLGERKSHEEYGGGGCLQIKNYEAKNIYMHICICIYHMYIFFNKRFFLKGQG